MTALLDLGANTESLDEPGFSALDVAPLEGTHDVAQVLLERGAKVRLPDPVGRCDRDVDPQWSAG